MRYFKTLVVSVSVGLGCVIAARQSAPAKAAAILPKAAGLVPSQRFADVDKAEEPSFRRHLIPLLARTGCSARECHGSFQGRGGFQLSLFGSEWEADHIQLTQKKGGEDEIRIDAKEPEKSLILQKPTLQMKHKGKERFKKDSWQYNLVLKWIRGGAKNDSDKTGELERLEVTPAEIVFARAGQKVQLHAIAHWEDGTVEDVTELTRFKTNDETVGSVSDDGLVLNTGKGDSHVVASYDNAVVPVPVMLAVTDQNGKNFPAIATHAKVDELVINKLRKIGVVPSDVCSDSEFLRRVMLDVTGTLPTPEEILSFSQDKSPNKRTAKIDQLLGTTAYAAWWTTKFCDYTGNSPNQIQFQAGPNLNYRGQSSQQWYDWLYKRIAENMPYDKIVEGIVLATGRSSDDQTYEQYIKEMTSYYRSDHPADFANHPTLTYFWQRRNATAPDDKALAFSHAFLGVRLECAQCHKHPFDRWTKTDFKQFVAFFGNVVSSGRPAVKDEKITFASLNKELRELVDQKVEAEFAAKSKDDSGKKSDLDPKTLKKLTPEGMKIRIQQKMLRDEIQRRVDTDQLVPWTELWVNMSGLRVAAKQQKNFDRSIKPRLLGGEKDVALGDYKDSRQPIMEWLRSKSNPYFAKAIVNRVWACYFNRGIVDPPDDLNLANAPCNGELLAYLANGLADHGWDLKWLHREILNSDTYQRSWKTNTTNHLDTRNFSHAVVRQLPAEVMSDAITMATVGDQRQATFLSEIEGRAIGSSSTSTYVRKGKGGNSDQYFLNLFGKPIRESNCDCERSADPTLLQTLFTRNDDSLLGKVEGNNGRNPGWIAQLRKANPNPKNLDVEKSIDLLFLRTVSRLPTDAERSQARTDIAAAKTPIDGVRDLLLTMINTREFKVNH